MRISRGFKVLKVVFRDRRSHFHISRWPFAFDSYCPHFYVSREWNFFFLFPVASSALNHRPYRDVLSKFTRARVRVCSYQRVAILVQIERIEFGPRSEEWSRNCEIFAEGQTRIDLDDVVTLLQECTPTIINSVFFFLSKHRTNSRADKNRLHVYFRWFRVLMMSQLENAELLKNS